MEQVEKRDPTLNEQEMISRLWVEEFKRYHADGISKAFKGLGISLAGMTVMGSVFVSSPNDLIITGCVAAVMIWIGTSMKKNDVRHRVFQEKIEAGSYKVAKAHTIKIWMNGRGRGREAFCRAQKDDGQLLPGIYKFPVYEARKLRPQGIMECPILLVFVEGEDRILAAPISN